jgi:hypothetical protein
MPSVVVVRRCSPCFSYEQRSWGRESCCCLPGILRTNGVPRRLQHVLLKRHARWRDICVVWATAASWVLSVEKGNGGGGGVADLLAVLAHFPTIIVAAADSACRYRQTSWHVRKVPLTCHVITMMC